ncbi:MAG: VCBS repeat-containing protein, partial [Planctomycetota bacterium]|nr:VCBS repeat-containing protein [Planctomycetota bacterium]
MSVRRNLLVLSPLFLAATAHAQTPGVVDYTPVPPPTAPWPILANSAAWVGGPGTDFANVGTGRGQALVDVVGPDPTDPSNPDKVGPPDGILDLIQTNSNSPGLPLGAPPAFLIVPPIGSVHSKSIVYRGDSGGKWTDVTDVMSPYDPQGFNIAYPGGSPWGVITADYDDDGDWDLFYVCGGFNTNSPNALMRNEGDGTFRNVSATAGLLDDQDTFGAAWIDGDRDGDLDIYVTNSVGIIPAFYQGDPNPDPTDRLYDNRGNGTFTDMAPLAGCDLKSNGFSVATGDLDQNGFTDIVVSCFQHYNKVFYNNGDKSFAFMGPSTNPSIQVSLDDMDPDPFH